MDKQVNITPSVKLPDLWSAVSAAEGDMACVYDHAVLLNDHLTSGNRIELEIQHALSWVSGDLLKAGDKLRKHSEALYAAAKADREHRANAPQIDGGPIFEPAKLSMEGLFSLHDAMKTVFDVLGGLENQPRFVGSRRSPDLPPAGDMLQKFSDYVAEVLSEIHNEACRRTVTNDADRERKFYFLASRYVDGSTSPEHALAEISKLWEACK